jgi:hypothetical protein
MPTKRKKKKNSRPLAQKTADGTDTPMLDRDEIDSFRHGA